MAMVVTLRQELFYSFNDKPAGVGVSPRKTRSPSGLSLNCLQNLPLNLPKEPPEGEWQFRHNSFAAFSIAQQLNVIALKQTP